MMNINLIKHTVKGPPITAVNAHEFMAATYMKNPSKLAKAGRIGFFGLGLASSVYMTDYRQKYGTGFAVAHGLASSTPVLWVGVMAAEMGVTAMEYGYQKYHERRRLNMGRPMMDSYGTMSAMKMNSLQKMQRGHNSIHRTIGNEARYLHR